MRLWENFSTNDKGNMMFGGCDVVELAEKYGTPLYVMDENIIRGVCREYVSAFSDCGASGKVMYASKALSTKAIYRILAQEGLGVDVVSVGELYTALTAGTQPEDINFHGNNKTLSDLEIAIDRGVGCIVIDSHEEIELISGIAGRKNATVKVALRIKPGVEAHTHEYIITGANDSKFGLGVLDGEAMRAADKILSQNNLVFAGLHMHIGSQIFGLESFELAVEAMVGFAAEIKKKHGHEFEELNFGGGFGIGYIEKDTPTSPKNYVEMLVKKLREQCSEKQLAIPKIIIEPGRSIVGEAGLSLYTIGTIKNIEGIRTYISVDGGMADNPRVALYQAEYTCVLANRPNDERNTVVTIAGRCCESGDILAKDIHLPECARGDILAMFSTGAYQYSMASNYNRLPRPEVLLLNNGVASTIIKRETYDQIMQNDCIPSWLD